MQSSRLACTAALSHYALNLVLINIIQKEMILKADSEGPDKPTQMHRLILSFAVANALKVQCYVAWLTHIL